MLESIVHGRLPFGDHRQAGEIRQERPNLMRRQYVVCVDRLERAPRHAAEQGVLRTLHHGQPAAELDRAEPGVVCYLCYLRLSGIKPTRSQLVKDGRVPEAPNRRARYR